MSPNKPKTPGRHIRIDTPLWTAAQTKAARLGINLSAKIRELIRAWVDEDD